MSTAPRRWLGGTVPIFFHGVLAGDLHVGSRYRSQTPAPEDGGARA